MVLITKSKTPTSTVLVVERQVDNNNDSNKQNEYIAGGEHSGIVINKIGKYGNKKCVTKNFIFIYICIDVIVYNVFIPNS